MGDRVRENGWLGYEINNTPSEWDNASVVATVASSSMFQGDLAPLKEKPWHNPDHFHTSLCVCVCVPTCFSFNDKVYWTFSNLKENRRYCVCSLLPDYLVILSGYESVNSYCHEKDKKKSASTVKM